MYKLRCSKCGKEVERERRLNYTTCGECKVERKSRYDMKYNRRKDVRKNIEEIALKYGFSKKIAKALASDTGVIDKILEERGE